jgi:extracellular matrix regulatory protein A
MHIGFDNQVPHWKVAAILVPRGSAGKRLRAEALAAGRLLDATAGRKTRSMVITDASQVILSAVNPETLRERLEKAREGA